MSAELLDLQAIGAETIAEYTPAREWACPVDGCDFLIGEVGPASEDVFDDPFRDEIDTHERMHIGEAVGWIDDGTEAEAIAVVEIPRSSSQAGLAALRYRVVA